MPIARVDMILFIADRNDWRKITLLMNACCEFFSWPKFLMNKRLFKHHRVLFFTAVFLTAKNRGKSGVLKEVRRGFAEVKLEIQTAIPPWQYHGKCTNTVYFRAVLCTHTLMHVHVAYINTNLTL